MSISASAVAIGMTTAVPKGVTPPRRQPSFACRNPQGNDLAARRPKAIWGLVQLQQRFVGPAGGTMGPTATPSDVYIALGTAY